MKHLSRLATLLLVAASLAGCVTRLSGPYGPASGAGLSGYANPQSRD